MLKQVAALPVREKTDGSLEVLLISSRETGRWVVPKGWPSSKLPDHGAAAREAEEEAGVHGRISAKQYGSYAYRKTLRGGNRMVEVSVFLLRVRKARGKWPEKKQRNRAWFDVKTASRLVREPRLRQLIAGLANDD